MGGCAAKLRKTFEAESEKPDPTVEAEEDNKAGEAAAGGTVEEFDERFKEIVGEDDNGNENEIAVVDEIQGCKQRPSLSLLFKQEVKDWAESEIQKPNNAEPILEAQEQEPTRRKEEDEQQHEQGKKKHQQSEAEVTPPLSEDVPAAAPTSVS